MAVFIPKEKPMDKGTQAFTQLVGFLVSCVIIFFLERIFSWFVKPLVTTVNPNAVRDMIEKKQEARDAYLERIASDPADPMYQFQLRCLDKVTEYKKDPDTKVYMNWYQSWKKGLILDSGLRWVPEVYKGESFNPKFLEYMRIQYGLHKKASFKNRAKFSQTISKFYPEFSSNLNGLGQDIAQYSESVAKEVIQEALAEEIKKFGLPDTYEEYLSTLSVKEVKKAVPYFQQCAELEYTSEAAILAYEEQLEVTQEARALDLATKVGLPAYVGLSYLQDEINENEMVELAKYVKTIHEDYDGEELYEIQPNGFSLYEELIDKQLKKYRINKRLAHI